MQVTQEIHVAGTGIPVLVLDQELSKDKLQLVSGSDKSQPHVTLTCQAQLTDKTPHLKFTSLLIKTISITFLSITNLLRVWIIQFDQFSPVDVDLGGRVGAENSMDPFGANGQTDPQKHVDSVI